MAWKLGLKPSRLPCTVRADSHCWCVSQPARGTCSCSQLQQLHDRLAAQQQQQQQQQQQHYEQGHTLCRAISARA